MEASTVRPSGATCPHFGECGGCSFLDLAYEVELARKREALAEVLAPVLPAGVVVEEVIGAQSPLGTRTSLKVPFARPGKSVRAGFFARGSHRIVDLERCVVQDPRLVRLLLRTKELCDRLRVPIYQEQWHKGLLRHLVARVALGTGEMLAGLVVRRAGAPAIRALAWALLEAAKDDGLVGVVEIRQPEASNKVLGETAERICGRPYLREESDGLTLTTGLLSFAQVNNEQARILHRRIVSCLEDEWGALAERTVADLYSGSGPIALRLAQAGARVVAVERNPHAVREGKANARRNDLHGRLSFLCADAARALPGLRERGLDAVVVDPPRRGLAEPLLEELRERPVGTVLYVSCHPRTLARDLEALSRSYEIRRVVPVDLFPRTEHVETVVVLNERKAEP